MDRPSSELIGSCGAFAVNGKYSTCQVGIAIGQDWQGKCYGSDALQMLISFIFNYIHVNKIKLQVFRFNQSAIRSCKKCGFIKEGLLRDDWATAREEI